MLYSNTNVISGKAICCLCLINHLTDCKHGCISVVENDAPMFHGLDTLVAHYCNTPVGPTSSATTLAKPCSGDPIPAEARLHGSSSLLHRSTSQGTYHFMECKRIFLQIFNPQSLFLGTSVHQAEFHNFPLASIYCHCIFFSLCTHMWT